MKTFEQLNESAKAVAISIVRSFREDATFSNEDDKAYFLSESVLIDFIDQNEYTFDEFGNLNE